MEETISTVYSRYTSDEIMNIFSPREKYRIWRKLWIELANSQKNLGLSISQKQIAEMIKAEEQIDFEAVKNIEKVTKHEVMAHIQAFAKQCPNAAGIIHLGATSSFVMDNTDLIQIKRALQLSSQKLLKVILQLASIAKQTADMPCLSYTHFQPAQPTTIGKRLTLWLQDLLSDYYELKSFGDELPFLGTKGATGTAASFLQLFDGDLEKVRQLDEQITKAMGFKHSIKICSQTYPRKIDYRLFSKLGAVAITAHKIGTDIRLLSGFQEVYEGQEKHQIGSSAMPYKDNPMISERLCSLSRLLLSFMNVSAENASLQWLERTLDDSANRRIMIPQGFYLLDGIIHLLYTFLDRMQIDQKKIQERLKEHMHLVLLEPLTLELVKQGSNRNFIHKELAKFFKNESLKNSRKEIFSELEKFAKSLNVRIPQTLLDQLSRLENLIGLACEQVLSFINHEITPLEHLQFSLPSMETASI